MIIIPLSQQASGGGLSLIQVSGRSPIRKRTKINVHVSSAAFVIMHYKAALPKANNAKECREMLRLGILWMYRYT